MKQVESKPMVPITARPDGQAAVGGVPMTWEGTGDKVMSWQLPKGAKVHIDTKTGVTRVASILGENKVGRQPLGK